MSLIQNKNRIRINNTLKSTNEVAKVLEILKNIGVFREKPKKRKPRQPKAKEDGSADIVGDLSSSGFFPSTSASKSIQALKSGVSANAQEQYAKEQAQLEQGQMIDERQQQQLLQLMNQQEDTGIDIIPNPFPRKESVVAGTNYEFQRSINPMSESIATQDISPVVSAQQGQFEDDITIGSAAGGSSGSSKRFPTRQPVKETGTAESVSGIFSGLPARGKFSKKESLGTPLSSFTRSDILDSEKLAWIEKALGMQKPRGNASVTELENFAREFEKESGIPFGIDKNKDTNLTRYRRAVNDRITEMINEGYEVLRQQGEISPPVRVRL